MSNSMQYCQQIAYSGSLVAMAVDLHLSSQYVHLGFILQLFKKVAKPKSMTTLDLLAVRTLPFFDLPSFVIYISESPNIGHA